MTPRPAPPVERVRRRLSDSLGPEIASALPTGFQRIGQVVVVKLPESLRSQFPAIGEAYRQEFRVRAVLRRRGGISGEFRLPATEPIAGHDTETVVTEHGIRYRFDAGRVMFAAGNHTERLRAGRLVQPGETVVDLFAGIGYFALPAAVLGRARRVHACEANPVAFRYLVENADRNGVADRVIAYRGDNREAPIPPGTAHRVFLGLLPEAAPWVPRALALLAAEGGWLHVHRLQGTRDADDAASGVVLDLVERSGRAVIEASVHTVKPYGPGRKHVVVDVHVGGRRDPPTAAGPSGSH